MTDRTAFQNPPITNPQLSASDLQKILALQGGILRKAVVSTDYGQLLDELCGLAESFTPNAVASIMLFDENKQALFVEHGPSLSQQALDAFNGIGPGDGSCGNAVFHAEPMYVCNTLVDPRWNSMKNVAVEFNICSCFSFPILSPEGVAIGSFAISSFEHREPNGFHQTLLETCTNIAGVILQRQADDALKQSMLAEQVRTERVESLGVLAGGIAHDFNNLLTAIMGNVDLAASTQSEAVASEGLEIALKALDKASELTRQLLTIAKGNSPIYTPNHIGSTITEAATFALHGSNVSFELIGLDCLESPMLNADGGQIGQLIQNLTLNARQAMPNGGAIKIICAEASHEEHPALKPGEYLRITVSDSGTGMSEEARKHAFEPYFTTREEGSGLGLALCYSIVKNHAGHILIDSEENVGTRFTIYLPRVPYSPVAATIPERIEGQTFEANVLIMDDDALVRSTITRILNQLGCTVWQTKEGAEAIAVFEQLRASAVAIDLTILDLTIPGGMGGIETKDRLRELDPESRIVVSSGYSAGETCIDHEAAGFDAAMLKPYRISDVENMLSHMLAD